MALEVIVFIVVVLVWAIIDWAAVVGLFGALMGERIERCPRCHHVGLTVDERIHEHGCPMGVREHASHVWHRSVHLLHIGHRLYFGQH